MAGFIVPTADEVKQEFRTIIMAAGRGQLLPNLDEFDRFYKRASASTADPWVDRGHGIKRIALEDEGVVLIRVHREFSIDNHQDGQMPRFRSQIREIAETIRNEAGDATIDYLFDCKQEEVAFTTNVKCGAQGIARVEA